MSISGIVRLGKPSKKAIFSLTDSASKRLHEIMKENKMEHCIGLKLGVKQKGCSGLAYTLDYATQKNKLDEIVTDNGINIIVDSKALMSVIGTEMDYITDDSKKEFIFINPNATSTCGCGESFTTKDTSSPWGFNANIKKTDTQQQPNILNNKNNSKI
ncbi:iron-sulfur cluster assembly 1 like protein [Tieghemostelium lacteum]|uniref:Iron-sulfur cluster assembly 1 like protein n=1 Tax=Tieghemostelium lacteum TaxID=361077 RepID=A0A152A0A8_TIELA|nr:iron-sulfur cluster assembly 1 like protein [Tieghemostelium lacteum]|eukprot:KYQ99677.1 iron-sulfur cluster assembly 1 like protein [Tieghemostelium lacteum]